MPRIAGVDIPDNKRVDISLTYIYGIGPKISRDILKEYKTKECLVIDDFNNDIDEQTLYSIINQAYHDNKYLIISSLNSIKNIQTKIKDLESRFRSFVDIGIDLPTDELIRVILTKNFYSIYGSYDIRGSTSQCFMLHAK